MKLSEIGEEGLIDRVVRESFLPMSGHGLVVGVGDDAAVLETESGPFTVVTTDMLTERMDFLLDRITPYQLGWKAVAANISDVAAMGGLPTWTFVSLGFRPDTEVEFVDQLYKGMTACTGRFGSAIAGGDMNSVKSDYVISITQMGMVEPEYIARRTGARVGDRVLVTGSLGDSLGGLCLLLDNGLDEAGRISDALVSAHLMPTPRVTEARSAVQTGRVHAMMDLSDGLGADLPKLCRASQVGAVVYADRLPISSELQRVSDLLGRKAIDLASSGGEDFELLMAVAPEDVLIVTEAVEGLTGTPVAEIGEIVEDGVEIAMPDGSRRPLKGGWEHFV